MILSLIAWILLVSPQEPPPLKPLDQFQFALDYTFKPRPTVDGSVIDLTETRKDRDRRNTGGDLLPYVVVRLKFLKLAENEVRLKCMDSDGKIRLARKVEVEKEYKLDLGYTDDIKDRVSPHEYIITLLDRDRKDVSRIVLFVEQDGVLMVNGTKRGKF